MNQRTKTDVLTLREAADYSKTGLDRITEAIAAGEIRIIKLGPKTRRVTTTELDRWIKSKTVKEIKR